MDGSEDTHALGSDAEEDQTLDTSEEEIEDGDEQDDVQEIVRLEGQPIENLERAVISSVIDLRALRIVVWTFHVDAEDFKSESCRWAWSWILRNSPSLDEVPDRNALRRAFRTQFGKPFRFVTTKYPLIPLCERLFATPRTVGPGPAPGPAFELTRDAERRRR